MTKEILAQLKEFEDCPVRGHLEQLDENRHVYLGQDPNRPGLWFLGFRNEDGDDTLIVLTDEAFQALKHLMTKPFKGKRIPYPYKAEWELVVQEKPNDESVDDKTTECGPLPRHNAEDEDR